MDVPFDVLLLEGCRRLDDRTPGSRFVCSACRGEILHLVEPKDVTPNLPPKQGVFMGDSVGTLCGKCVFYLLEQIKKVQDSEEPIECEISALVANTVATCSKCAGRGFFRDLEDQWDCDVCAGTGIIFRRHEAPGAKSP